MTIDTSGELSLPTDTGALDARALEIATTPFATHAARSELAAICYLRLHRCTTKDEVLKQTAADLHLQGMLENDGSNQEVLQEPVFDTCDAVWSNLERLVRGETVTYEPVPEPADPDHETGADYENYSAWTERRKAAVQEWLKTAMADLEQALRSELLYDFELAKYLPADIVREVYSEAARDHFDGVFGIGASLESLPSSSAGGMGMPNKDTGVWVADWLARNVIHSLAELEKPDLDEAERVAQGRYLHLSWSLLKGFIYSGAYGYMGQSLTGMLVNKPEVVTRICDALTSGLEGLTTKYNVPSEDWRGPNGEFASRIASTTTADLVAQLRKRIKDERQSSEDLRSVR